MLSLALVASPLALNAAVNGDIITLSPGAFQAVNITKAVSIRGAGMSEDTIAGTNSTVLLGAFRLRIPNDLNHRLYMEGLSCAGDMEYDTVYNPYFVKCEFDEVSNYDASKSIMLTPNFVNCLIYSFSNYTGQNNNGCAQSPIFINSVIMNMYGNTANYGNWSLLNCVAFMDCGFMNYGSSRNSILFGTYGSTSTNTFSAYNNIGITTIGAEPYFYSGNTYYHNNYNFYSYAAVFKTFRGTLGEGITFELQDSIATKYLGSDGTQIGIYGGQEPFNPSVRNPQIKKINVAQRSNAEGKLPVDIEIVSE